MSVHIRAANEGDVDELYEFIDSYAKQGIMLPRSKRMLLREIGDFVIAELDEKLVGCGSLCRLGQNLVEIRSLGVLDGYQGRGIGRMLVEKLTEAAQELKIPQLMALTYEADFFVKLGFHVVSKDIFPEKVWKDCVFCPKQDCCDEIAVLKRLDELDTD